ncbi:hypothetical protein ACSBL2_08850 [Pedobacter sp. AW31-3R]|uniref:hypothetical protein n=1 Tax=Pedobacter sp. AW31-3R TaxID=3445781 RepID=UPI003F9F77D4
MSTYLEFLFTALLIFTGSILLLKFRPSNKRRSGSFHKGKKSGTKKTVPVLSKDSFKFMVFLCIACLFLPEMRYLMGSGLVIFW